MMDDVATTPETGVADAPASEQDFSDFENSLNEAPKEAPAQAEDEPTDFVDDDDPDGADEAASESDAADEELVEIEVSGKKYKVPKEIERGFLREGDYTQKTQALAAEKQQVEAFLTQATQVSEAEQTAIANFHAINAEIAKIEGTDWSQADQMTRMQAQLDYQALTARRNDAAAQYQQAQAQRFSLAEQETARRFEEGRKVLAEKIPDWGEKAPKVAKYAQETFGFDMEELASVEDPRAFLVLNRLVDLEAQLSKQQAAEKAAKTTEIKPVQTLKGNQGRSGPRADTNDFLAFEAMADKKIRTRR